MDISLALTTAFRPDLGLLTHALIRYASIVLAVDPTLKTGIPS